MNKNPKYKSASHCPMCDGDSGIRMTIERPTGERIRYRRCYSCGTTFTTVETFRRVSHLGEQWRRPNG